MSQGSVSQDEPRSAGPTHEDGSGTGLDAPVAGAAILLSLYGLAVIVWDLVADESLVPESGLAVAGIIIGCLVVGAVLGGFASGRSDR